MKKIIAILATLIMCFALVSCSCSGKKKDSSPTSTNSSQPSTSIGSDREVGGEFNWD